MSAIEGSAVEVRDLRVGFGSGSEYREVVVGGISFSLLLANAWPSSASPARARASALRAR